MSYTIQAIIGKSGSLKSVNVASTKLITLEQDMEMLPLTDQFLEEYKISFLPLTDEGLEELPENLKLLCEQASKNKQIAYIEAEIFGGQGTQACTIFNNSKIVFGPLVDDNAINKALKHLGVEKRTGHDEFESLGLNKNRDTNNWV